MKQKILQLVNYALDKGLIEKEDIIFAVNNIIAALNVDGIDFCDLEKECMEVTPLSSLQETLDTLCDFAYENKVIDGNTTTYFDLFDTKLMGLLTPRPSEVIKRFDELMKQSPQKATKWYYDFSQNTNYIRRERIEKDRKWIVSTEYGDLDITINLSKPEKDPKAIAAAGKIASTEYPKCLLCAENEGYAGRLNHPARQNHRVIPMSLAHGDYYLQYSPYVYYNEHCIIFNKNHTPMVIDQNAFENLLEFVSKFPHYIAGSNADLPIVGGSVLSHDHYQGGNYEFPMARAQVEKEFTVSGFEDVSAGIVKWPMSVIRLSCTDRKRLSELGGHILDAWRTYDDERAFIFHKSGDENHSTITPIARYKDGKYELDLVLRNNITTKEHPMGVYHPHADKHHIKKENIGLIEVMGLAILPARLLTELEAVKIALLDGLDMSDNPLTKSHEKWALDIRKRHPKMNSDNVDSILNNETGLVFKEVLEDAGVFKRDEEGIKAFGRFIDSL